MTEYNTLNVNLPNSQLNKLKPGIKYSSEVTLSLLSNMIGNFLDRCNFPHKLSLTNIQTSKLRKAFANSSSANIKLSKTQLHKMGQSRRFLTRRLGPLLKNGLPLMKNILKPLANT